MHSTRSQPHREVSNFSSGSHTCSPGFRNDRFPVGSAFQSWSFQNGQRSWLGTIIGIWHSPGNEPDGPNLYPWEVLLAHCLRGVPLWVLYIGRCQLELASLFQFKPFLWCCFTVAGYTFVIRLRLTAVTSVIAWAHVSVKTNLLV